MNFIVILSTSTKYLSELLVGIALKLYINLGRTEPLYSIDSSIHRHKHKYTNSTLIKLKKKATLKLNTHIG